MPGYFRPTNLQDVKTCLNELRDFNKSEAEQLLVFEPVLEPIGVDVQRLESHKESMPDWLSRLKAYTKTTIVVYTKLVEKMEACTLPQVKSENDVPVQPDVISILKTNQEEVDAQEYSEALANKAGLIAEIKGHLEKALVQVAAGLAVTPHTAIDNDMGAVAAARQQSTSAGTQINALG